VGAALGGARPAISKPPAISAPTFATSQADVVSALRTQDEGFGQSYWEDLAPDVLQLDHKFVAIFPNPFIARAQQQAILWIALCSQGIARPSCAETCNADMWRFFSAA
jgi:hypothetical protein